MGALTAIRIISQFGTGRRQSCYQLPVKGSTIIYQGASVGKDANGFAVPMNGTDNTLTAYGIARATANNSAGADGAIEVMVDPGVFPMTGAGLGYADVGKKAYATSDQDFSTSSSSGVRPFLGIIEFVDSATSARISIQPPDGAADALEAELASTANGLGASKVALEDALTLYDAAQVEAALAEARTTLRLKSTTELTIAAGAVTVTQSMHRVDTEADAASDDLDTISGTVDGKLYFLRPENVARNIVLRDTGGGAGNIRTPRAQSITLVALTDWAVLLSDGTNLTVIAHRTAAGPTRSIGLSVYDFREVSAGGDVGDIAAIGGVLASDTTPVLRGNAAETAEIMWAAGNADIIGAHVTLPADFNGAFDVTVDLFVYTDNGGGGGIEAATFTVETGWDNGALVSDAATDSVPATTIHVVTATIAAADIPDTARVLTLMLTPGAHAADPVQLLGARLNYRSTSA